MRSPSPTEPDVPRLRRRLLWYELGGLYEEAAGDLRRAVLFGVVVLCGVGALVLLSAPLFGTALWAGPAVAGAVPVAAGLAAGLGLLARRRARFSRERARLEGALADLGEDARRPTSGGLDAYGDVQLLLLRSEYEYLVERWGGRGGPAGSSRAPSAFTPRTASRRGR